MLVKVRTNQVSWCSRWQTLCSVTVILLGPFSLQSHNFWKKLLACFCLCCQWKDIQILFSRFFPSSISLLPVKLWLPLLLAIPPRSPPPPPSSGSQATLMNCLLRTAFAPSQMIPSGSHLGSPALLYFFSKFSCLIKIPVLNTHPKMLIFSPKGKLIPVLTPLTSVDLPLEHEYLIVFHFWVPLVLR